MGIPIKRIKFDEVMYGGDFLVQDGWYTKLNSATFDYHDLMDVCNSCGKTRRNAVDPLGHLVHFCPKQRVDIRSL